MNEQPADLACGIFFCDADNLKTLNDTQGHQAGDVYLNTIVEVLQQSIRQSDHLVRWGGDEFLLVTPSCTFLPALDELSQRLQRSLQQAQVSCSIGFALRQPGEDWQAAVSRADQQMYKMKAQHHSQAKKHAKKKRVTPSQWAQKRETIADTIDILPVVQHYVALKKEGAVWRGLCPFHADHRTPSLTIYPGTKRENGHYHCFGCRAHGDVIQFVKEVQHCTIGEAIDALMGETWTPAPEPRHADNIWGEWAIPSYWIDRYRAVWSHLALFPQHRDHLRQRGLSDAAIDAHGFRSMPTERIGWMQKLSWTPEDLRGVPGFSWKDDGHFHGPRGFLIPVRRRDTAIIGAQIHPDDSDVGKYLWWSTADPDKYPGGASSGSPPHWAWPGNQAYDDVAELWITEGPLKAIIAAEYLEMPVIGLAGLGRFNAALPILEALKPQRVIVAFDADIKTNEALGRLVTQALHAYRQVMTADGQLWMADWDAQEGKGIDDVLLRDGAWDVIRPPQVS
jgi:diguanylate cyclase (GGDEF)-like protein